MIDKKYVYSMLIMIVYFSGIILLIYYYMVPETYEKKIYIIESFDHKTCKMSIYIPCEKKCEYDLKYCKIDNILLGSVKECCPIKTDLLFVNKIQYGIFLVITYVKDIFMYIIGLFIMVSLGVHMIS